MKFITSLLLFIGLIGFLLLTTSCPKCDDSDCIDIEIGIAKLNDSSSMWIPFNSYDTVNFINSNGFHAQFFSSGYQYASFKALYRDYDYNCGDPMEACWEYYTIPVKYLKFNSESINLTLQ